MVILSGGSGGVNKITFLRSPPEKANQRDLGAQVEGRREQPPDLFFSSGPLCIIHSLFVYYTLINNTLKIGCTIFKAVPIFLGFPPCLASSIFRADLIFRGQCRHTLVIAHVLFKTAPKFHGYQGTQAKPNESVLAEAICRACAEDTFSKYSPLFSHFLCDVQDMCYI